MTKDFHSCDDCFDNITESILKQYQGCRCPACMSLIMASIHKIDFKKEEPKKEGGVGKKTNCLNGSCAADSGW